MIYDLSNASQIDACRARLTFLKDKKRIVELKEVRKNRSLDQNAYLHKLFSILADEIGDTLENVKHDVKIHLGHYTETTSGNKRPLPTANLNTKDFAEFTDKFIKWALTDLGITLPTPEQQYE